MDNIKKLREDAENLAKNNKEAKALIENLFSEIDNAQNDYNIIAKALLQYEKKLNSISNFEEKNDILEKLESLKTLLSISIEHNNTINEVTGNLTSVLSNLNSAQEIINDYGLSDEISSDENYSEIVRLAKAIGLKKNDDGMFSEINKTKKDLENVARLSEKIESFKENVEGLKDRNEELKKSANAGLNFLRDDIKKRAEKMEIFFSSKEKDRTGGLGLGGRKKESKRLSDLSKIENLGKNCKSKKEIENQFKKQIQNLKNLDSEFLTELENKANEILENELFENNNEIKENISKLKEQKNDLHKIVNPENWKKENYENFGKWALEYDTEDGKKNELKINFNAESEILTNGIGNLAKSLKTSLEKIKENKNELDNTKKVQKERFNEFSDTEESEKFNEFEATKDQVEGKFKEVETEYKKVLNKISNFKEFDLVKSEFENVKNISNSESSNVAKFIYLNNFEKFLKQFENLDENGKEKVDFDYIQEKEEILFNEANKFGLLNEDGISEIKDSGINISDLLVKYNSATTETDKKLHLKNLEKENDKLNKISENIEREKILLENLKNTAKNFVKGFNQNFNEKKKYFEGINGVDFSEIKNLEENIFENIKNKKDLNKKFEEVKNSLKENNEKLRNTLSSKISQIESDREKYGCKTFVTLDTKHILRGITESNEELDKIDFKLVFTEKEKNTLIKEKGIDDFNSYLVDLRTEVNNTFTERDNKLKSELKNLSGEVKRLDKIVETAKISVENLKTGIKSILDNLNLDEPDLIKDELQKIIDGDDTIPAHAKARAEKLVGLIDNQESVEQNFINEIENKNKLSELKDISKKVNSLSDLYNKLNKEDDLGGNLEGTLNGLDSKFFNNFDKKEDDGETKEENTEDFDNQVKEEIENYLNSDTNQELIPGNNGQEPENEKSSGKIGNSFSNAWGGLKKFGSKIKNLFTSKNKNSVSKASEGSSGEQKITKDSKKTAS